MVTPMPYTGYPAPGREQIILLGIPFKHGQYQDLDIPDEEKVIPVIHWFQNWVSERSFLVIKFKFELLEKNGRQVLYFKKIIILHVWLGQRVRLEDDVTNSFAQRCGYGCSFLMWLFLFSFNTFFLLNSASGGDKGLLKSEASFIIFVHDEVNNSRNELQFDPHIRLQLN